MRFFLALLVFSLCSTSYAQQLRLTPSGAYRFEEIRTDSRIVPYERTVKVYQHSDGFETVIAPYNYDDSVPPVVLTQVRPGVYAPVSQYANRRRNRILIVQPIRPARRETKPEVLLHD